MTQFDKRNSSMMMDFYEMTMAYGYFKGKFVQMKWFDGYVNILKRTGKSVKQSSVSPVEKTLPFQT